MKNNNRKKYSSKIGLPPGSLVYLGNKTTSVSISSIVYDKNKVSEHKLSEINNEVTKVINDNFLWLNINGLNNINILGQVSTHFKINPLIMEDILNTNKRPKIEEFENYAYIAIKMLRMDANKKIINEHISILFGKNFVITFQEEEGDVFDKIRDRIRLDKGIIRQMGSDYLAYCIIDAIVDNYFYILELVEDDIDNLEEEVINDSGNDTLSKIHNLKRNIINLRKHIWPMREILSTLEKIDMPYFSVKLKQYIKDVYEHTIQVIDTIESFRDMTSGLADLYMSLTGNKMNEIMKVLTIIATIFIPLTFLAGVYGMNFKNMPELNQPLGYPVLIGVMIIITILLLMFFKRKKWL